MTDEAGIILRTSGEVPDLTAGFAAHIRRGWLKHDESTKTLSLSGAGAAITQEADCAESQAGFDKWLTQGEMSSVYTEAVPTPRAARPQ